MSDSEMVSYYCNACGHEHRQAAVDSIPPMCGHCGEAGSEPMHVAGRSGSWWTNEALKTPDMPRKKAGRKPINGTAMTPAQRKARSREIQINTTNGHLEAAARLARDWITCMIHGRNGATDKDIEQAFIELDNMIACAQMSMPRS